MFIDNTDTSGTMKELRHAKNGKGPRSYILPRTVKVEKSSEISMILEENMDCFSLGSEVAVRFSGPGQRDYKSKITENYEVRARQSSSDQHEW